MKRRDFIKVGSILTIPVFFNGLGLKVFANKPVPSINEYNDKILVLIQMDGGNDTLNTVIPLDQYSNLSKVRSNIMIPDSKVIKLNDITGFHPVMEGLRNVMDDGKLNVVRAVGYPNQNRSHFRSTDIWMSGSAADVQKTSGWLGSYFKVEHPDYPAGYPNSDIDYPFAITIGSTASNTCQGNLGNYSIAVSDANQAGELFEGEWDSVPDNCFGDQLSFVRETIRQSNAYSDIVSEAYNKGNNLSTKYPEDNKLAANLKDVAKMISGGLKTKVYVVRLGGFDTHSGQVDATDVTKGNHSDLLKALSDAIEAFQDDLKLLDKEERVIGVTFSEFGRRIKSNASLGTDHGSAVDMFVFGKCINSGFLGNNPTISDNVEKKEAVAMQTDFRNVYGSLLIDWFEASEEDVKSFLHQDFRKLPIVSSCSSSSNKDILKDDFAITISPNPVIQTTNLSFMGNGEWIKISLVNELGEEVLLIKNTNFANVRNELPIDMSSLKPGVYFMRLKSKNSQTTKKIIKV